jgi:hypothetical protein
MEIVDSLSARKDSRLSEKKENLGKNILLLEENASSERFILKNIGLVSHLSELDQSMEEVLLDEKYEKEYGQAFHYTDIRSTCLKYRLYLRNSGDYRGKLPDDFLSEVLSFSRKNNLSIEQSPMTTHKFFIMAPPSFFIKYLGFWKKLEMLFDSRDRSSRNANEKLQKRQGSLSLFYKLDSSHYCLVKSWKNNLWHRKVWGFVLSSFSKARIFAWLLFTVAQYMTIKLLLFSLSNSVKDDIVNWSMMLYSASALFFFVFLCICFSKIMEKEKYGTKKPYLLRTTVTENRLKDQGIV